MSAPPPAERPRVPWVPAIRVGRIVWRMLPWVAFAALPPACALLLRAPPWILHQTIVAALSVGAYALVTALAAEILSPTRKELRLVPVSDHQARRLTGLLRFFLFFVLVTELGAWLVDANHWRPAVAALLRLARNVMLVAIAAGLLSGSGIFRRLRANTRETYLGLVGRVTGRFLFPLAVLAAFALVVTYGLGYAPFARYVLGGVIWTGVQILIAAVVYRYLYGALKSGLALAESEDARGDGGGKPNPEALGVERIGAGLLKLVVTGAGFLWVLSGWGLGPRSILDGLDDPIVSGGTLTWGVFLGGVGRVAAVLFVGWLLRNVLTFFVFPRGRMDVGARYAILAVLRYVVVAFAAVFGLQAIGLSTDSLGWFFGAAGIGLAFGLQDILGNFFSGLIMLLERPIRVGDIIEVGTDCGTVEDIRMRGTTIRTFDNTTILIPNRQMLGERVTNLTYGLGHSRVRVDVGVSYDSQPEEVRKILLDAAETHPSTLNDPPPSVTFQGYGASSLDFTLFCYTDKVRSRLGVASDLRYEIFRRLKEAGIEIPFPQQDIHVRTGPPSA